MSPSFVVAIPARLSASRLPGKPLRLLGGEPLVRHVARRALAAGADDVVVAADDASILAALDGIAVRGVLTRSDHASGTDRLAECARLAGWSDDTLVVNLQGDEPFAPASGIRAVARTLADSGAEMATLATEVDDAEQLFDPNTVKLVWRDPIGDAQWRDVMYFSRAPIPWHRDAFAQSALVEGGRVLMPGQCLRHIGIYAYRVGFLQRFAAMPQGRLEQLESLEQLRVLEAGFRIAAALAPETFPPGVDTPEDLARAEARLAQGGA
ncbi:MAG: 3-deoxy-manno-octulosonate cytidylyltransferase [Proteobacteria bacterium]|nr:3-deoxy-manno-octulosonate cytidylyltransferase [Pseudomonadota bacterium]MBS0218342.1 3-deoxy-manno-octulosonate cytidylyltransferase [Pseudomonadota bacterium]